MEYNIRTCLPTCPDYDPETKMCRKLEEFPEPTTLGQPCSFDVGAAKFFEEVFAETLENEDTIKGTAWKPDKEQQFKSLLDLSEKVRRLSPRVRKQIFFPTDRDTHAMVFLYFPLPTMIFNAAMKNTLTELFAVADEVAFNLEDGSLKIMFSVAKIWKEL